MIQRIIEIFQKIIITNKEKEEKENNQKKLELFSERKILNVTPIFGLQLLMNLKQMKKFGFWLNWSKMIFVYTLK